MSFVVCPLLRNHFHYSGNTNHTEFWPWYEAPHTHQCNCRCSGRRLILLRISRNSQQLCQLYCDCDKAGKNKLRTYSCKKKLCSDASSSACIFVSNERDSNAFKQCSPCYLRNYSADFQSPKSAPFEIKYGSKTIEWPNFTDLGATDYVTRQVKGQDFGSL